MISVRKLVLAATVALGVTASDAAANPPYGCTGPFCNQPRYPTLSSHLMSWKKQPLPTFQAAPWYLYWPYDAHFLTPAPVTGPFYGPPGHGNFPVNPYFPAPAYGPYGPIPGGPPPGYGYPPPGSYPPPGYPPPGYPPPGTVPPGTVPPGTVPNGGTIPPIELKK